MKPRTRIFKQNRCAPKHHLAHTSAHSQVADLFLALDRILVEVSMDMYNLTGADRRKMRAHNGRVHRALREHLSQLRKRSLEQ